MILDLMTYSLAAVVIVILAVVVKLALGDKLGNKSIDSHPAEPGNDSA